MKRAIPILILLLTVVISKAQVAGGDPKFQKLFDLYAMEKFEDCAYKADAMTQNDKYKKDPEPYLYVSMSYKRIYEMDDPKLAEAYPKALKDAMNFAYKFRKKDDYWVKKGEEALYPQNIEYINELKKLGIQEAKALIVEEQHRKAAYPLKYIVKFDPADYNVLYAKGVCDIISKNAGEGAMALRDALEGLDSLYSIADYKADLVSGPFLAEAMIMYSEFLNTNNEIDSARTVITLAKRFFRDDFDVSNQYNKLHGLEVKVKEDFDPTKSTKTHHTHVSDVDNQGTDEIKKEGEVKKEGEEAKKEEKPKKRKSGFGGEEEEEEEE